MKFLLSISLFLISWMTLAQNFVYSGFIYNADGSGASNVPVMLYRRTTPNIVGFTQQTNYDGHSYYRSTSSMTWTNAKIACENMGGHLATISTSGENNFLYNTWPSGWIGLYQDKTGAFYSEPNGGWRWTENEVTDYVHNFDSKNYTTTLIDNVGSRNSTMYNGPTRVTSGGNYIQFDGVNDYAITGDLSSSFPNSSEIQTIQLLCYPQEPGVLVSELGVGNAMSGWHESVMEITSNGNLRVGFWNGSGISSVGTTITMNQWHQITMTYDGNTLRGYLDGTYFGEITFDRAIPHASSSNGLYYCFGKEESTNMGNGTFAQYRFGSFQVYNRKLSDDEIMRNWMYISYRYGRMKYTNWNGGEPNNAGGEDYIQFVSYGRWNDLPNTSLPYVLEFDYVVTTSDWTLHTTTYTNSNGYYSFNIPSDPSKEYYIKIDTPTPSQSFTDLDGKRFSDIIFGNIQINGLSFHRYDLNNDGKINVSDQFLLFGIKSGLITNWVIPRSRLFTQSQFTSISNSNINVWSLYPGSTSLSTSTLTNGGSQNFYLISPGYSGKVTF